MGKAIELQQSCGFGLVRKGSSINFSKKGSTASRPASLNARSTIRCLLLFVVVGIINIGTASAQLITNSIGNGTPTNYADNGDGGEAWAANLNAPTGVAISRQYPHDIYVAEYLAWRLRKVGTTLSETGIISTIGGGGPYDTIPVTMLNTTISKPLSVAVDNNGGIYLAVQGDSTIKYIDKNQYIWTIASKSDSIIATLNGSSFLPMGLAVDYNNNVYFSVNSTHSFVYKMNALIAPSIDSPGNAPILGAISVYAGDTSTSSTPTYTQPADSIAVHAKFAKLAGLAIDSASGNLYIADVGQDAILRVDTLGHITQIAGNGYCSSCGHGKYTDGADTATKYSLNFPSGIAVDNRTGVVYFADGDNEVIRKLIPTDLTRSVFKMGRLAGSIDSIVSHTCSGCSWSQTDTGRCDTQNCSSALNAHFSIAPKNGYIAGLAVDYQGEVYVCDFGHNRVRVIYQSPQPITATSPSICVGGSDTLSTTDSIVVWGTSSISLGEMDWVTGIITAAAPGIYTSTYWYLFAPSSQCDRTAPDFSFTINPPASITDTTTLLCIGSSITYFDDTTGGIWKTTDSTVASIDSFGHILGIAVGTTNVSYSFPTTGCVVTQQVTVQSPSAGVIIGSNQICLGNTTSLSDTILGGIWQSSDTTVVIIDTTGTVTGIASGTASIFYSFSNSCGIVTDTFNIMVLPLPSIKISAPTAICFGSSTQLIGVGGLTYTWNTDSSLSANSGDTVLATPFVTDTYFVSGTDSNGCINTATATVVVNPLPDSILGAMSICQGGTITLSDDSTGGYWSASNANGVFPSDSTIGQITAVSYGLDTVTYSLITGCSASAVVTINPIPSLYSFSNVICFSSPDSEFLNLNVSDSGGSWNISDTTLISISGYGDSTIVTGLAIGIANITYTSSLGCVNSTSIVVDSVPNVSISDNINIFCPTTTTTLVASSTDTNTLSYAWYPASFVDAPFNSTADVVGITATTTFSLTVTDSLGCSNYDSISVVVPSGPCNPCKEDLHQPLINLGSVITNDSIQIGADGVQTILPPGHYYADLDISIHGQVLFADSPSLRSTIEINGNKTMYVAGDASLILNGNHLYSCPDQMWNGIVLGSLPADSLNPYGQTATIYAGAFVPATGDSVSTLIEDARVGISLDQATVPNSWLPNFITCNSAIFNRNYMGISVTNTSSISGVDSNNNYLCQVQNSVFTCRDLSLPLMGPGYPFNWPNTSPGSMFTLGTLKYRITTGITEYDNPYEVSLYPSADCHIPIFSGNYIGIYLNNVGTATFPDYSSMVVGMPTFTNSTFTDCYNNEINLFDNIYAGVSASNSNVILHNNAFTQPRVRRMGSIVLGGYGVFSQMTDGTHYQVVIEPTSTAWLNGHGGTINSFYSCRYGLYCKDYYHITADSSYIVTNQDYTSPLYDANEFGYLIKSKAYDNVMLNNNRITNTSNGISFTSTYAPGYYSAFFKMYIDPQQYAGNVFVNNNTINAAFTSTPADLLTHATNFGIAVQNTANYGVPVTIHVAGVVKTNNNSIADASKGILVNSYGTQQAFSTDNSISVRSHTGPTETCYGISHTFNRNNFVSRNIVTGSNPTDDMIDQNMMGFYSSSCMNATMACNNESDLNRGYEFYIQNPNTGWNNNSLSNNRSGFVLKQSIINQQGYAGTPMNNKWLISGSSTWVGVSNLQTAVLGTSSSFSAIYSPFYVENTALTNPNNNYADNPSNAYDTSNGSIVITNPAFFPVECLDVTKIGIEEAAMHHSKQVYEPFALNSTPFPSVDSDVRSWIGQYLTWRNAQCDTNLLDSSAIIASFVNMASNSSYAYLDSIEHSIIVGDTNTAMGLIASPPPPLVGSGTYFDSVTGATVVDDSSDSYIVSNSLLYYKIYLRYLNGTLNCADSNSLAYISDLCPSLYGPIVFQSRALYSAVFDALRVWSDSCNVQPDGNQCQCGQNARRASKNSSNSGIGNFNQSYQIQPNPNNGNFTLVELYPDINPVNIDIYDVLGQKIYTKQTNFANLQININLANKLSGVYMLKITDSDGHLFTLKFVEQ